MRFKSKEQWIIPQIKNKKALDLGCVCLLFPQFSETYGYLVKKVKKWGFIDDKENKLYRLAISYRSYACL